MKRIGEILVEHGWIEAEVLDRALAKQGEFPRRLCSLLIAGGALDVDRASRALGEQHGVPAVLQKHLDYRDEELAALIPAELARAWFVLPIGRMGNGDLIVCARDPGPEVRAALAAVLTDSVVLAVAPASQIENLVAETYGAAEEDFDVDLNTGPIMSLDLERDPMAALDNLQLVQLDDKHVTRDLTQSDMIQTGPQRATALPPSSAGIRVPTLPPPSTSATPVTAEAAEPPPFDASQIAVGTQPPRRSFVDVAPGLPETLDLLLTARTAEEATTAAMRFAAGRWRAALLLRINDKQAIGRAGHGSLLSEDVVAGLALPLSVPSIVSLACETRALSTEPPAEATPVQARLERLLGMPRFPAAMPVLVAGRCTYVLAIGDPTTDDTDAATADLDGLAQALGSAHTRLPRGF
ncbi:hypothetical protein BH11MYX3_BH11MYX3_21130 [soil metagenome]